MVRRAIALVGREQAVFEAALDIMQMPAFDPAHLAVLQIPANAVVPPVDAVFPVEMEIAGTHRWRTGKPTTRWNGFCDCRESQLRRPGSGASTRIGSNCTRPLTAGWWFRRSSRSTRAGRRPSREHRSTFSEPTVC